MNTVKHFLVDCSPGTERQPLAEGCYHDIVTAADGVFRVGVVLDDGGTPPGADPADVLSFCVGDPQDAGNAGAAGTWLGNGILGTFDSVKSRFTITGSITGLPCLFCYEGNGRLIFATSVALIALHLDGQLELDEAGILDLAEVGHPVGGRTLFRKLSLVAAGTRVEVDRDGIRRDTWSPPALHRATDHHEYLTAVAAACDAAIVRMDLAGAVLSLTAGLDTRAILALLARHDRLLPACTIAGPRDTIDSQRAAELCRTYGLDHHVVHLDHRFDASLPDYCMTASLLSGGLTSLGQAHELHLYAELAGRYTARLSGNLGNQIGRSGTEGVGTRGVADGLFSPRLRADFDSLRPGHWFERLEGGRRDPLRFLVQQENLYASQANHCIGHHHARQLTPYADAGVIALKAHEPAATDRGHEPLAVRLRDIRHRFLGEPAATSFQRRIVSDVGGAAATIPVNWGWRPRGGSAWRETLQGWRAFLDMGTRFAGLDGGRWRSVLASLRIDGYSDFHRHDLIHQPDVHDLLVDTVAATCLADSDLFEHHAVASLLRGGPTQRRGAVERGFLLDVALALRIFGSRDHLARELRVNRCSPTACGER